MAWETINHTCGHSAQVQLYGPGADRARRKAAMETDACVDCRAAASTLTGSPKQVAWAEDIRARALPEIRVTIAERRAKITAAVPPAQIAPEEFDRRRAMMLDMLAEREAAIITSTSARDWIDGKMTAPTLIELAVSVTKLTAK